MIDADEILRSLRAALDPQRMDDQHGHRVMWVHRDLPANLEIPETSATVIDKEWIEQAAAKYLARPWLQHNEIDWMLLDSLVYAETSACRELSRMDLAQYGFGPHTPWTRTWENVVGKPHPALDAFRPLLLPILSATLYWLDFRVTSYFFLAAYAMVVLLNMVQLVRFQNKVKTTAYRVQGLLLQMWQVYVLCTPQ